MNDKKENPVKPEKLIKVKLVFPGVPKYGTARHYVKGKLVMLYVDRITEIPANYLLDLKKQQPFVREV